MHNIIYQANLVRAFEIILIILIFYYVFSFIMRTLLPSLIRKYINDFQKGFNNQDKASYEEQARKKEGEISITYVEKDKNVTHKPDAGEYVDYEEIK